MGFDFVLRHPPVVEQWRAALAAPCEEQTWAEAMGFTFGSVAVEAIDPGQWVLFIMPFTCVCGRREEAHIRIDWHMIQERVDPSDTTGVRPMVCSLWYRDGAFTREHLLEDGYTEAQIDAMYDRARAKGFRTPEDYEREDEERARRPAWRL